MRANTAIQPTTPPAAQAPPTVAPFLLDARGKKRHLLSTLSDRRSMRQIGGFGAYLRQVRWSLWWALRD